MTGEPALHFSDTVALNAPWELVWQALNDARIVGQCVPGLEEAEISDDGRSISGRARMGAGRSALTFPAKVTWVEREAPRRGRLEAVVTVGGYEIVGVGTISLAAAGDNSATLSWDASVQFPEKLAENAMILQMARSFAARFTQAFFRCLQERVASV